MAVLSMCVSEMEKENKNRNSLFLSVISHNINNMQTRAVPQLGAVLEKGGDFFSTVDFL